MSRGGWEEGMRASERGVLIRGLVADVFLGEDEEVVHVAAWWRWVAHNRQSS